jgi:DNA-binding CsgD family transcriptional regulator/tetratricopeptide (TPR) repeat protein
VPSTSTRLIGRDDSLGRLTALLERASAGHPAVALVSGETGVGKTALVRELVATTDALPFMGACVPVAGEALPFAPLSQALRALRRSPWGDRVRLPPDLARLTPGGLDPAADDAEPDQAVSRLRLFDAVLDLLHRLGRHRPVVHVVEDLHWSDRSTLDLLRFLAGNLHTERVLVVTTYRSDDPADGEALPAWLAEVARLPLAERIPLDRLGPVETGLLIDRLTGGAATAEVRESALVRSAGNPLFVEHLVESLAAGETALPATLRELLHVRVARHGGETRRLLRAASVVGRVMPLEVLAAIAAEDPERVEEALRPAFEQHLLEVRNGSTLGFRHPALREVVYAELLPAERARLHRRAAEALADSTDPASAGEVARHWHLAGDRRRALAASVEAGYAAERICAFADARTSFARAVELMDDVGTDRLSGDLPPPSRTELLEHAARAASVIGEHDEAVELVTRALGSVDDPDVRVRLLERLGAYEFFAGRGDRAEAAYREALALVAADEVSAMTASLHAGLALMAAAWSRFDESEEHGALALRTARQTGNRPAEGVALNALGTTTAGSGDPVRGAELLRQSLAVARETEVPDDIAVVHVNLVHVLGQANLLGEAVEVGREGIEVARRSGLMRQYGGLLLSNIGDCLIRSGRLDEAEEVVEQALGEGPRGIQAVPALMQAGRLATVRGDLAFAWERLEQARVAVEAESAPDAWHREVLEALIEVELWAGRPAAAYELAVDGLTMCCSGDERRFGATLVMLGLRALADQADLLRRDDEGRERLGRERVELRGLAVRLDPDPLESDEGPTVEARSAALTCRAELARLDGEPANERFARAAEAWAEIGRPMPAAYARWREAEAELRDGADAAGIEALRRSHRLATDLGAVHLLDELQALAGLYRVELVPASAATVPAQRSPHDVLDGYGLTAREREVLAGLAAGRTNQAIADELFISVKTASVHVSNILRKMEVSGRQEAGRLAHRLGLGHPS